MYKTCCYQLTVLPHTDGAADIAPRPAQALNFDNAALFNMEAYQSLKLLAHSAKQEHDALLGR